MIPVDNTAATHTPSDPLHPSFQGVIKVSATAGQKLGRHGEAAEDVQVSAAGCTDAARFSYRTLQLTAAL